MYERGVAAFATEGSETLAAVVAPYFERKWNHFCSHFQTPPDSPTGHAAAVALGPVVYISYPIFRAFALHANAPYRGLVAAALERLLPDPLLRATGPSGLEATVTEQPGRRIVHLLYYVPERRAPGLDLVEDIIPLSDIEMSLRCAARPSRVYLTPEERDLPYVYDGQRVAVTIPQVRGHAMVVVETEPATEAAAR
jgi:hypothetical protein